jgi:putative two-component system response regulator
MIHPGLVRTVEILAVDDQELNLDLLKLAFEAFQPSVRVRTALNGKEALALLRGDRGFDLVFLDLEMPVMDGFQLLDHIRADERLSGLPVIVVSASRDNKKRALKHGASDFASKPFDPEELRLRAHNHLRLKYHQDMLSDVNRVLEGEVWSKIEQLEGALREARDAEYEIALRLGTACEYRDTETGQHIIRSSHYAGQLGRLAGLSDEDCRLLRHAAPLHDVGKIGLPDSILQKPAKLTEAEFEIIKLHSMIGAQILKGAERFPVLRAGTIIAEQHHEKWNGSGYPRGRAGQEIHLFARIVAIGDVFDALTSKRVYKPAFSAEKSLQIMREGNGTHFDPELFAIFDANFQTFVDIKLAMPDVESGELANVHLS